MKRIFLALVAVLLVALPVVDSFARGGRGAGGAGLRGAGRTRARNTKSKKNRARLEERKEAQLRDSLRIEAARDRS